jgi:hypothetical protein
MPYVYEEQRPWVFTEEGQRKLLRTLGQARACIAMSGAVMLEKLIGTGDPWNSLAAIDRLVELGYLEYIRKDGHAQTRVLVAGGTVFP